MRLLIVDDEKQIRDGMCSGIPWSEYGIDEVVAAEDGVSAWEQFSQQAFDIVITDIRMPGMDGIELSRRIFELRPATQIMVFSGHSEFEYVYAAMKLGVSSFELKPVHAKEVIAFVQGCVEKLNMALLENQRDRMYTDAFKDNLLRQMILGNDEAQAQNSPHFEQLFGKAATEVPYFFLIRYLGKGDMLLPESMDEKQGFFGALESALQHGFAQETTVFWKATPVDAVFLVYFKKGFFAHRRIQPALEQAIASTREHFPCATTAAVVPPSKAVSISRQYKRAVKLLEHTLYTGCNKVMQDDGSLAALHAGEHSFWNAESLKQGVEPADEGPVLEALDTEFSKIAKARQLDNASVHNFCYDFLNLLRLVILSSQYGAAILRENSVLKLFQVERQDTLEAYRSAMHEQCRKIFLALRENCAQHYSPAIQNALSFLREHYAEPLTTELVAAHIKKSPNYFSQKFNTELGISFPEYVSKIRIEAAKKLIDDHSNNLLIYEIAEKVGFTDYKYFSKVFRQVVGCSVSDYKKRT